MSIQIIGIIVLCGGVWITQDSLASILYYLKNDSEKWYFNHAVRVIRGLVGIMLIILGCKLIFMGG